MYSDNDSNTQTTSSKPLTIPVIFSAHSNMLPFLRKNYSVSQHLIPLMKSFRQKTLLAWVPKWKLNICGHVLLIHS